jgi:hypothetical protein
VAKNSRFPVKFPSKRESPTRERFAGDWLHRHEFIQKIHYINWHERDIGTDAAALLPPSLAKAV